MPTEKQIKEAIFIRCTENKFIKLFSEGRLNGTVHTSVGQEFSALAFAGQLNSEDFVVSNHRCHGHYLAFTKDYTGLIAELMGKSSGVCGGIGSSQHLQRDNFYSNGIQGGIVPVAAGMAFANKLSKNGRIGVVYIGDGTLGQGVVYEALNIISLWKLPLIVVCENNKYAQSTSIKDNLAGGILSRAKSFGIKTQEYNTESPAELLNGAKEIIEDVRKTCRPAFVLVNTYRLNAHSKGDDDRDPKEIELYKDKDFINKFSKENKKLYNKLYDEAEECISNIIERLSHVDETSFNDYAEKNLHENNNSHWKPMQSSDTDRQVKLINKSLNEWLKSDPKNVLIGEDVHSPYGGAFKVANNLSAYYPNQVFTTPISEAAITGIGNGLALSGYRPIIEIMFGDFITLALDQIINHASKFHHMYNKHVHCPIIIRTPMGGRRGYGPTHSQTLDRFLISIENVTTVALNCYIDPALIYQQVFKLKDPVIVIENKIDYGKVVTTPKKENYQTLMVDKPFPIIKLRPVVSKPNLTVVTYGGMSSIILECLDDLFYNHDLKVEVLILTSINPVDYDAIIDSCRDSGRIVFAEEGPSIGGVGSEVLSVLVEKIDFPLQILKIGAISIPIPSVKSLEDQVLPSKISIIEQISRRFS